MHDCRSSEGDPTEALVRAALAEDVGAGDRTTEWTVEPNAEGRAVVIARQAGVIAGTTPARRVFERVDPSIVQRWSREDGDPAEPDDEVLEISGSLASILTAERAALNFLAHLSGVATLAARFVAEVEGTGCQVTDTRKTTPGLRLLEKAAATAGGARNHRAGLYDMVLIKENHAVAAGGIAPAIRAARGRAVAAGLEVEVEVRTLDELAEALEAGPDRILLDNMTIADLRAAVATVAARAAPRPLLEASGGVTLATVREVAGTGVDLVSIGAITHSAPALDLSLLVIE